MVAPPIADSGKDPVRSTLAGDPEFRELLQLFVTEIVDRRKQLAADTESGDVQRIRARAHQIKGVGSGFGFPGLTAIAAELEDACRSSDSGQIADVVRRTLGYMERITL